jgi:uncharacterized protein (DUF302 family)
VSQQYNRNQAILEGTPMLIKMESKKSLEQVCQDLEKAVMANKFGVMTVHNLNETMAKKGVRFDRPCRIFEVCNPHQAKKVLEKNIDISTFLPCRISVFTDGDGVVLTTLKPTELISHFNALELKPVAQEVEEALTKIMREAVA